MSPLPVNGQHVLYVDDEEKALLYFRQMFEDEYVVHTAATAAEGYRILETYGSRIGVLLADQRMPGESGVELMERARRLNPNLIRILVTAFTDYQTAVKAVNDGRVFRYLHKPLDPEELANILRQGMEVYQTLTERDRLLGEKAESIRHTLMADKVAGLGIMAEGLNHHLRNALTVVRAFIDLAPMKLMEEVEGRPPRDANFWVETQQHAQAQIERIQTLLNHLAQASHARKLIREDEVTLPKVLEEAFTMFGSHLHDRGLKVTFDLSPTLPRLLVHGERFRQLWRLLFIEEITHLQHGDHFKIEAAVELDQTGREFLVMRLTDNGNWATKIDRAANIFDPFYTRSRKPDDFGINMMACYVTLHLHGGTIDARRLEPHGLELTMRLPLDPSFSLPESDDFFRRAVEHEQRWRAREELAA
ncbi:MAG: hybrid sensor histidine kinase/response regulator [Prosthecobacter sp.]|nr:hybrid sensor histidine kinase/response regulator [Prosthecobacter sp.]